MLQPRLGIAARSLIQQKSSEPIELLQGAFGAPSRERVHCAMFRTFTANKFFLAMSRDRG